MSCASGFPYGMRLLELLVNHGLQIHFVMSQAAQVVAAMETELNLPAKVEQLAPFFQEKFQAAPGQIAIYGQQQWAAPIASGSSVSDAMVVCPCSSGCLSAIAVGASNNLLERAADVSLKEQKKLILVHRETPLSAIHLENMLTLARAGAVILPANPGFYHKPESVEGIIDFVVARILDHLGLEHALLPRWGV